MTGATSNIGATTSGMLVPSMIENLLSWLPRFLLPLWQMMLRRLPRRRRLIIIEQPRSSWDYLDGDGAIRLHLLLHVTNENNTDIVIVSRTQVRVRRAGWKFLFSKDPWQDCMMVDVGEQRLMPGYVAASLLPRTTTVVRIIHHYKSERPEPKQPIKCLLRITDQRRRFHSVHLTVPANVRDPA
jgi:hypothetical protein